MAGESSPMEPLPGRTLQLEREYKWLEVASLLVDILKSIPAEDAIGRTRMNEELAYAKLRGAFQSSGIEQFRIRLQEAVLEFHKAVEVLTSAEDPEYDWLLSRCKSIAMYAEYRLNDDVGRKSKLVRESWELAADSLNQMKMPVLGTELARTYNRLVVTLAYAPA